MLRAQVHLVIKSEVDALGVITISRGCFFCCSNSNKKTPPYHSNLSFVALKTGGRRCSVRPHTVRRPRLALGDGAAARVSRTAIRASGATAVYKSESLPCSFRVNPFFGHTANTTTDYTNYDKPKTRLR